MSFHWPVFSPIVRTRVLTYFMHCDVHKIAVKIPGILFRKDDPQNLNYLKCSIFLNKYFTKDLIRELFQANSFAAALDTFLKARANLLDSHTPRKEIHQKQSSIVNE